jgi:hypothetical protein
MLGWWYLSGIYFTVVSLVSCSSPLLPHSATEMTLSLFLHVFGWVFGSLLISTLAAWPVDTKPLQCVSPALLKSLAFAMHRKNREVNAVSVRFKDWFLPEQNCQRALFIGRGYCTGWCSCRLAHEGAAVGAGPPQALAAAAVALAAAGVHGHL